MGIVGSLLILFGRWVPLHGFSSNFGQRPFFACRIDHLIFRTICETFCKTDHPNQALSINQSMNSLVYLCMLSILKISQYLLFCFKSTFAYKKYILKFEKIGFKKNQSSYSTYQIFFKENGLFFNILLASSFSTGPDLHQHMCRNAWTWRQSRQCLRGWRWFQWEQVESAKKKGQSVHLLAKIGRKLGRMEPEGKHKAHKCQQFLRDLFLLSVSSFWTYLFSPKLNFESMSLFFLFLTACSFPGQSRTRQIEDIFPFHPAMKKRWESFATEAIHHPGAI